MKLSVLIVNWNTRDLVLKCIDSVLRSSTDFNLEVIVVDNHSEDGSAAALLEKFGNQKRVQIIKAERNLGFARGNNLAYRRSSGEYILLLNPDTEILPWSAAKLIRFFDQNSKAAVVGAKIINTDGTIQPSVRRFPTFWASMIILLGLHRILRPKKYFADDFDYDQTAEVDQVMGAALLTRRRIIDQLGFLDEKFWLWYEEVDFCKRVKEAGFRVVYYPEAVVMHHAGKSFSQMSPVERKKTMAASLAHYFEKHGNLFEVFLIKILTPLAIVLTVIISYIERLLGVKHRIKF